METTGVAAEDADVTGVADADRRAGMYRLRKWQRRVRVANAVERNLSFALSEINTLMLSMGLPESAGIAGAGLYRRAIRGNLIRGRSSDAVIAASLYAGCRMEGIPARLSDFEDASGVSRKIIGKTYRCIVNSLRMRMDPEDPSDYVDAICDRLGTGDGIRSTAAEVLRRALEKGAGSGCIPSSIAAASVFIAYIESEEAITKKAVAEAAGISQTTMDARCRDLATRLDIKA